MNNIMTDNPQKFLEVALEAVKKAEPIFCKHFGKASGIEKKNDVSRSPVTDTDKEIESIITSYLSAQFPDHSISGEELEPQRKSATYTWYIDPIDGTINYIRGLPFVSISLALWEGDSPLVAIVSDPITRVRYSAICGQGAFKNGTHRLTTSSVNKLGDSMGGTGRGRALTENASLQRVARAFYRNREYGGAAMELSAIAEGKLDFWISERTKAVDIAAGMLILTEAGGAVTDWEGTSFTARALQAVASNGKIHDELLKELKG